MKYKIQKNVWDNWNGYEGSKKAIEFGTDERAAKEWIDEKTKLTVRKVYIVKARDTFCVCYLDRVKGQHYQAAQFHESMKNITEVEQWIHDQPNIALVQPPQYSANIDRIIYAEPFRSMTAEQRADLIAAIADQMGLPASIQETVKAIVSDYQP